MCTGLTGFQLLFDAAVYQRQMGQDLPEDLQVAGVGSLRVHPCARGAASAMQ